MVVFSSRAVYDCRQDGREEQVCQVEEKRPEVKILKILHFFLQNNKVLER